jgi:hypothetical protein
MPSQVHESGDSWSFLGTGLEKRTGEGIQTEEGMRTSSRRQSRRRRVQLAAFIFAGCCISLFWVFSDCLPASHWKLRVAHTVKSDVATFDLVKYQAPSPTPSPTGVLECFQVYQPVLTPGGVTGETVLGDGSENTTTIAPVASDTSCQVVSMQHDFAFSYGIPFVGELCQASFLLLAD